MSIQSRIRDAARRGSNPKPPAHRRVEPPKLKPVNITELQDRSHKESVRATAKDRDIRAGRVGAFKNWLEKRLRGVMFWPPWMRDNFQSEAHYLVHHRKAAMLSAVNEPYHPYHKAASEARSLGLI